jgi:hypothetical protein
MREQQVLGVAKEIFTYGAVINTANFTRQLASLIKLLIFQMLILPSNRECRDR